MCAYIENTYTYVWTGLPGDSWRLTYGMYFMCIVSCVNDTS